MLSLQFSQDGIGSAQRFEAPQPHPGRLVLVPNGPEIQILGDGVEGAKRGRVIVSPGGNFGQRVSSTEGVERGVHGVLVVGLRRCGGVGEPIWGQSRFLGGHDRRPIAGLKG